MRVFLGLCGSVKNGYESSSRGEGRWALSLARCLSENGHEVAMAPDSEPCEWGSCPNPNGILMVQPGEKWKLDKIHFDIAIFTSWQTEQLEARYIHADKYAWGVMGWKHEIMKDGYFKDNDYVIRWVSSDLDEIPYPINFRDRCFLLAQPFGPYIGKEKFSNKRVGWVAKEAFLDTTHPSLSESAARHLLGVIEACRRTGAGLSIFSSHELDPRVAPRVKSLGVWDELIKLPNVTMYPSLPVNEYKKELCKCSVTMPLAFAGSIQESVFNGLVPFMYKDSMFSNHPKIGNICSELTQDKVSRFQSDDERNNVLSSGSIASLVERLLIDMRYFEHFLYGMRQMVFENLDNNVLDQLKCIMEHKNNRNNIRS